MRLHLIDTDVFIRANREHYGLDYCPAFWDWLGFHGQAGNVGSVVAVLEEIRYPVELKQWARGPGFVDWRYAGEDKALNTNPSDPDEAVEALMAVYEEAETT